MAQRNVFQPGEYDKLFLPHPTRPGAVIINWRLSKRCNDPRYTVVTKVEEGDYEWLVFTFVGEEDVEKLPQSLSYIDYLPEALRKHFEGAGRMGPALEYARRPEIIAIHADLARLPKCALHGTVSCFCCFLHIELH